jgi:hypothetical protein
MPFKPRLTYALYPSPHLNIGIECAKILIFPHTRALFIAVIMVIFRNRCCFGVIQCLEGWPLKHYNSQYCIDYISPWTGFELTTLVVIGTNCTVSCNSDYHAITDMLSLIVYIYMYSRTLEASNVSSDTVTVWGKINIFAHSIPIFKCTATTTP